MEGTSYPHKVWITAAVVFGLVLYHCQLERPEKRHYFRLKAHHAPEPALVASHASQVIAAAASQRHAYAADGPVTVASVLERSGKLLLLDNNRFFSYVVEALHLALTEHGIQHEIVSSIAPNDNRTYVIFTTHDGHVMPTSYISYNLEQLITDREWHPSFFERLRAAQMVWDYSRENIKVLQQNSINATVHLPLGYAPNMENPLPAVPKDVDVMFVGWLAGKRMAKLNQLQSYNDTLKIVYTQNHWGQELLALYRRSKVALNFQFFEGRTILEVHRILPLLVSKVLVLSEPSDDSWWDNEYKAVVDFTAASNITGPVLNMLAVYVEAEAERRYQRLLACCSYVQYLGRALHQSLPGPSY